MGTSRQTTESQLEKAKAALEIRIKSLKEKGVEAKKFKNDPKWRELDAQVRQINSRLRKIGEIETNNEELLKHKEERQAKKTKKKAERKAGAKKPKPEKAAAPKKAKAEAKPAKDKEKKPSKEKK